MVINFQLSEKTLGTNLEKTYMLLHIYVLRDEDDYFYVTKEHNILKINSKSDIINN